MLLPEMLARNARLFADETALVERDPKMGTRREITWMDFYIQANSFAGALVSLGLKKGDRVVLIMTNCLEWLPIYFGILSAGCVAVPLNFRFEAETISHCALLSGAKCLIFGPEFIERINSVKTGLDRSVSSYIFVGQPGLRPVYAQAHADLLSVSRNTKPDIDILLTDRAGIYFTSGTTGVPKGVLLTHRQLEFSCYVENHHHRQTHADNFLCIPPLYHTGAKMHWFGNFMVGAPTVLLKGVKPRWILDAVSEEMVTIVWLLVPWAHDIIVAIENSDLDPADFRLGQWRLMHIGAQPVPPTLIRKWRRYFPEQEYDTNYGLTEATGPGCVHLGVENTHKIGAIGVPGFDWECRVVDEIGNDLPYETAGELWVKGPGVMEKYYRNPDATAASLTKGWLHTGDIVRKDEEGFLWLIDRKKDIIISGGENIFPVEIEDFLMTHDDIMDAAVIGVPHERLGEAVAAVIQLKTGKRLDTDDIFRFCEALPRYKRPGRIFFDKVSRNPTGKIEKPKLREKYGN
ncbi:MAG: AMP-binding protein [Deltaproteobacteria bacterium]|nr:AMP-binding protein [Deltaproteobacteria bacterium]